MSPASHQPCADRSPEMQLVANEMHRKDKNHMRSQYLKYLACKVSQDLV